MPAPQDFTKHTLLRIMKYTIIIICYRVYTILLFLATSVFLAKEAWQDLCALFGILAVCE